MLQLLSIRQRNDHLEKIADFQGGKAVNGTFGGLYMTVNPDALGGTTRVWAGILQSALRSPVFSLLCLL